MDTLKYVLTLYIAGTDAISLQAIGNFKKLVEEKFDDTVETTIVDVFERPDLAQKDRIIASPMLVKSHPLPIRKVLGDLSNTDRVLFGLGIS